MAIPKFINSKGGIFLEANKPGETDTYVEEGKLYDDIISGKYGPIIPYSASLEEFKYRDADDTEIRRSNMSVSRFQARAALLKAGLLDQVQVVMNDPNTDPLVKLAWQDAQEFNRLSPTIIKIASSLKLSDDQLDTLFDQAGDITA